MEVTAVDCSDHVGWAAAATRIGEVVMTDVSSMVTNVLGAVGQSSLDRLNILDHGNSSGAEIGSDWIDVSTFPAFEPWFLLLRPKFSQNGFVHLQGCMIGNNQPLMALFARAFGVRVYAGTGYQNPVYRFNTGDYVVCSPAGVCTSNVARP